MNCGDSNIARIAICEIWKSRNFLARAGHFLTNGLVHSADGRIALKPVDLEGDSSGIQRFTHVLEEMVVRGIDYRDSRVIQAMKAPKPKSAKVMRAFKGTCQQKVARKDHR